MKAIVIAVLVALAVLVLAVPALGEKNVPAKRQKVPVCQNGEIVLVTVSSGKTDDGTCD